MEYWRDFGGETAQTIALAVVKGFVSERETISDVGLQDVIADLLREDSESDTDEGSDYSSDDTYDSERDEEPVESDSAKPSGILGSYLTPNELGTSPSSVLPVSVTFRYAQVRGPDDPIVANLEPYWPHPHGDAYQAFFAQFFSGEARGANGHDWRTEIQNYASPGPPSQGQMEQSAKAPTLSVWQAAGYLHAKKVVECDDVKGCLFYWTPGSGTRILIFCCGR